jgi:cation transporter-like permease
MHIGRLTTTSAFAFLFFFEPVAALRKPQILTTTMSKTNDSSSVLGELKDTIQKQKTEIEALKKLLNAGKNPAAATSHGGHGGGDVSIDELASYLTLPFYRVALKRVWWLSLFLVSLSFTALIMNGFEHTLKRQLELAYFVPLLAGHGGNTGGQAVGTVLSAMSAGFISTKDAPRIVLKEALSGLLSGAIMGCAIGPVAHFAMGISPHVSTVIACTIPLVSIIAGTLGSAIPFLCISFGQDPSVIAAPAMTSFVDVTGLMAYFLIANQIFALYGIEL